MVISVCVCVSACVSLNRGVNGGFFTYSLTGGEESCSSFFEEQGPSGIVLVIEWTNGVCGGQAL